MNLVPLPVAIPLGTAAVLAALDRFLPRRVADSISILATLAAGTICLDLLHTASMQPVVYWFGGWTPRAGIALGISFMVDTVGAGLATLVCLLVLAAFVFSWHYFESVGTHFHVLLLVFLAAMCGFSLTGDLFNMFVFFELMSASAFALCGYKTEEVGPVQGALNFAVTNTIAAFVVLTGIALLYSRTGALNLAQIGRALGSSIDNVGVIAFAFIMAGFFVKAAIVPFHFWLADAHAVAPTPVCILFSGVMVELGLYAVARVYWSAFDGVFAPHRPAITGLLLTVGALTAIIGGVMCFGQRHLKRLLAYSTISHMGVMLIGFALLKPGALSGVALYVVGHGLVKSALFIVSGILLHRLASVDEFDLRGRARDLWATGAVFFVAALGLAGLPPFATFLGEAATEEAAAKAGQSWVWIFIFVAAVLTAGAVFRVAGRVFLGWGGHNDSSSGKKIAEEPETQDSGSDHVIPPEMFVPAALLTLLAIALGLVPGITQAAHNAAATMADGAAYQARVLDHAWLPMPWVPVEHVFPLASVIRSVAATLCALALALFSLSPYWSAARKSVLKPVGHLMVGLRAVHSGRAGDYVAFLTLGVAAFGVALSVLIKLRT